MYIKNDVLVLYEKWNEIQQKFERESTLKYHAESLRKHWRSQAVDTLENIERILKWLQQSEVLEPHGSFKGIEPKLDKWELARQKVLSQIENGELQAIILQFQKLQPTNEIF